MLRPSARRVRDIVKRPAYLYENDGVATMHLSPFLKEENFDARYKGAGDAWEGKDLRWRVWILTRSAAHCARLDGSFAEFGVYRAGCAFMILSESLPHPRRSYYLFDTFAGIPDSNLTERETAEGFAGRLADVSLAQVQARLGRWTDRLVYVVGDIFKTLPETETGPLAFVHLDLNAAAVTEFALRYVWSRLLPSGIVVFDDYGWEGYQDQRLLVDAFFAEQKEALIALPTGQALAIKA